MSIIKDKFYCQVTTRNYPVNITPIISRYTMVTKYFTTSQIAMCLQCHADVKLIKGTSKITLTQSNYKSTLISYINSQISIQNNIEKEKEEKKNEEVIDTIKARTPEKITKSTKNKNVEQITEYVDEEIQQDPENPDTFDESKFY